MSVNMKYLQKKNKVKSCHSHVDAGCNWLRIENLFAIKKNGFEWKFKFQKFENLERIHTKIRSYMIFKRNSPSKLHLMLNM